MTTSPKDDNSTDSATNVFFVNDVNEASGILSNEQQSDINSFLSSKNVIKQNTDISIRVQKIYREKVAISATENLEVRIGFKATVDAVQGGLFRHPVLLSGDRLTGEYVRLSITPPGQQEQDVFQFEARELYGSEPLVGDSGLVFYAFFDDQTFFQQNSIFPFRPERGLYVLTLRSFVFKSNALGTFCDLQPSITILADGRQVVDTLYSAPQINMIQEIEEQWSFNH